jgi:hypothetical protein
MEADVAGTGAESRRNNRNRRGGDGDCCSSMSMRLKRRGQS